MRADGLFGGDVVDVCPGDAEAAAGLWAAAGAGAVLFDRGKVGGERALAQVQRASSRDGIAEALCRIDFQWGKDQYHSQSYRRPRRPDAVKHVGAQGDGHEQILRVALREMSALNSVWRQEAFTDHAHDVSWFRLG